jgi:predicted kinase
MLVALAGLPGTGKSTLAARLADSLGGVILSKDVVRSVLFPPPVLDSSREQDDIAMNAVFAAAERILTTDPARAVLLDGRTFSKPYQVADALALAARVRQPLCVIECMCADEIAETRLAADHAAGTHPAGNRTAELYARAKAIATPLTVPRLTLDTGTLMPDECVRRALAHVRSCG